MNNRKRAPLLTLGTAALALGLALVVLGIGYGQGCDFDTMDVCRPFGVLSGSSFLVSGIAGLILLAGLILGALGGLLVLVRLCRLNPGAVHE